MVFEARDKQTILFTTGSVLEFLHHNFWRPLSGLFKHRPKYRLFFNAIENQYLVCQPGLDVSHCFKNSWLEKSNQNNTRRFVLDTYGIVYSRVSDVGSKRDTFYSKSEIVAVGVHWQCLEPLLILKINLFQQTSCFWPNGKHKNSNLLVCLYSIYVSIFLFVTRLIFTGMKKENCICSGASPFFLNLFTLKPQVVEKI